MKTPYLLSACLVTLVCFLMSCEDDKVTTIFYSEEEYKILTARLDLPAEPYTYDRFDFGQVSSVDHIGTLGRVLFYDKQLSKDNSVSCGSCHQQGLAFADAKAFSTGISNRSTARNSIALGAFGSFDDYTGDPSTTLFWDGRVNNLHDQMVETIGNPNEMGMTLEEIEDKIQGLDYYEILGEKAFNTSRLDRSLILVALEGFMNSISSTTTKFDGAMSGAPNPALNVAWSHFNSQENLGKKLFADNCVSCHSQGLAFFPVFDTSGFGEVIRSANNGLDMVYTDKGAGEHDPSPKALGVFKVPALRNIALSAPYMHDGRFNTLEEVIDFYGSGIQDHENLHRLLKNGEEPKQFNFTSTEKEALVAFLHTLTDFNMVNEAKWSDPFKQ